MPLLLGLADLARHRDSLTKVILSFRVVLTAAALQGARRAGKSWLAKTDLPLLLCDSACNAACVQIPLRDTSLPDCDLSHSLRARI